MMLTGVHYLLDHNSNLSLEHRIQQLHNANEASAQNEQRTRQQNETHRQVRKGCVHKDVTACVNGEQHRTVSVLFKHI